MKIGTQAVHKMFFHCTKSHSNPHTVSVTPTSQHRSSFFMLRKKKSQPSAKRTKKPTDRRTNLRIHKHEGTLFSNILDVFVISKSLTKFCLARRNFGQPDKILSGIFKWLSRRNEPWEEDENWHTDSSNDVPPLRQVSFKSPRSQLHSNQSASLNFFLLKMLKSLLSTMKTIN